MAQDTDALTIEVRGKIRDFQRAMAQAESRVNKLEKSVDRDMRRIQQSSRQAAQSVERSFSQSTRNVLSQVQRMRGGIAGALGGLGMGAGAGFLATAGAGGLVASVNEAASSITQLRAEADRAGVAFEQFQRLQFVSEQQKVSIDALTDGLKELQLRADEFIVTGVGPAREAFERLGFGAEDLARRLEDPIKLMMEIMRRAQDLDTAGQIRVFDELFGGTGGEQFVQLMRAGPEALRRGMADASIVTDEVAEKAARVEQRFQEIANVTETWVKTSLVNAADFIGTEILPRAREVAAAIGAWVDAASEFLEADLSALPEGSRIITDAEREAAAFKERLVESNDELTAAEAEALRLAQQMADAKKLGNELQIPRLLEDLREAQVEIQRLTEAFNDLIRGAQMGLNFGLSVPNMPFPDGAPPGIGPAGSVGTPRARDTLQRRLADGNEDISRLTDAAAAGAAAVLSMPQFAGVGITSAYRSPEHNAAIGGAPNSRHMSGDALDFTGVTPQNVGALVTALRAAGFRGFGFYNNGTLHADMGAARAWGPDRTSGSLGETPLAFRQAVSFGPSPATAINPETGQFDANASRALANQLWQDDLARQDRENAAAAAGGAVGGAAAASPAADAEARNLQAEALERVNAALQKQLELLGLESEQLQAGLVTREELAAAADAESLAREKIRDLKEAGVEVTQQMEEAIRAEVAALYELQAAQDQVQGSTQQLAERTKALQGAFQAVGQPILDTFMSIISGSEDASEALKRLAMQLANMLLQGVLFGSGPLGSLMGGGLFGGALAAGGPAKAGTPYLVGERGPELFVPGASGQVIDAATTRAAMSRAAQPVGGTAASGGEIVIVSRFDADGGFASAVERASRPVAVREARSAAGEVAARVPEMVDARTGEREARRTRPLRPALSLGG